MSLYQQQRMQTKKQIYDTAMELFQRQGYEKVTIEDITKSVGIAKGTFYNFFPSKREILLLWSTQQFQQFDFFQALNDNKSIQENMNSLIDFLVKCIAENHKMFRSFLNELLRMSTTNQESNGDYDFIQIFSHVISKSNDFNSIGKAYFKEKITVLNNALFLSLIHWFNKEKTIEGLEQYLKNIVKICLNGILKNMED
jgi:Transcriptional regulator